MPFSFVQSVQNSTGGATSLALTISAAPAGSLIVINCKFGNTSVGIPTASDNAASPNTYAAANSVVGAVVTTGMVSSSSQLYGVQVTGGATTITVSFNGVSSSARITAEVFTGGASSNAAVFDKFASAVAAANGTSGSIPAFAPASSGLLVSVGATFTGAGTFTAGTNYTVGTNQTNQSTMYRLNSGTSETAPASWVNSVDWALLAGVYKVSGSTPVTNSGFFTMF